MAGATVTSLKMLQQLDKEAGDREGVPVVVGAELERLCDASAMVKLLERKIQDKGWVVTGIAKLEPLVPIVLSINAASRRVINLHNVLDIGVIYFGPGKELDKHRNQIRKAANKLKTVAKELTDSNIKRVQLLGDSLKEAADDVLRKMRQIGPDCVKSHFEKLDNLDKARKQCAKVYNMKMKLAADGDTN